MSVKGLPSLLDRFRYQERISPRFLKCSSCPLMSENDVDSHDPNINTMMNTRHKKGNPHHLNAKSPPRMLNSNTSEHAESTMSSPSCSFHSQDSEVTCIPETPSVVSTPSSPVMSGTKHVARRHEAKLICNTFSSDSEDCGTPKMKPNSRERRPPVKPIGERKFRSISTGSEDPDSDDDTRSSSPVFGASSTCHHSEQQKLSGTSACGSFKFNKTLNLASTFKWSPIQYTALPSSSESDTDATTLDSNSNKSSLNKAGLSELYSESPPPTVRRKRKRRRILSEGQESIDGGFEEENIETKQKEDIMKLQEMFPQLKAKKLKDTLVSVDWCVKEAASVIIGQDIDDGQSDSPKGRRVQKKKRRKVEHLSDKENNQRWLSKSKMTSYFPKITRPGQQISKLKQRRPDKEILSSEDETFSLSSDDSDEDASYDKNGEEDEEQTEMNHLIVSFFNDATPEELLSISQCSKAKVKKIEALRPFEDYSDLIAKFDDTKGLSSTLVWNCHEVFQSQQVITTLMNNCAKIADNIQSIICQLLPDQKEETNEGRIEGQVTKQPAHLSDRLVLKPYQMIGLNWLALIHRQGVNGILADEMGLGKTVQTIAFLAHLMEQGDGGPHLIVVPSSTLENWARELHTWCPALEVILYTGTVEERRELRENILNEYLTCNVIVTSYNMCISNADDRSLFRKMGIHYVVFDEAHMLKNMQSQRYKFLMKIRAERKLLLTGTPLQNNLKELISLLSFVMPHVFCDNAAELQKTFSLTKQKSDDPLKQSKFERERIAHAKQIMQPFILRRVKSEVLKQLPSKTECVVKCPMIKSQEDRYNEIKAMLSRDFCSLGGGAKMEMTKLSCAMMQLRKAANHEVLMRHHYDDSTLQQMAKLMLKEPSHCDANPDLIFEDMSVMNDFELHKLCHEYSILTPFRLSTDLLLASGKFQILDKMLPDMKQKGDRVLMFSQFVMVLDIIESYMKHHQYRYLRLDGQTPVCDRLALIDKYNSDEDIFVFLLSTRAGGLGINLTSANHVILHDIDYNPYNDKQAEDRCHRVGQKRDVTVTKLISSNSIEEGMLRCAQYKLQLEEQMTRNDCSGEDAKNATDVARLLKDALEL
ncbi:SWI/SNF-related matrix-associated actin-dependent regulator of chromatin subfamily A containing DEAD/H box 1-like isoform X2 [Acanthaster planci]|uniref:DNA helicase n=1 Tax=Acanthaster planci TaxID=133434 RepID=A0A8B7XRB2_ACAPL|nr:SWI/SNF-related matrix-associated actin-dependent regulator of chromatin subfamily A containing DEAD/H box 1-like isoform X2 [Acanthaster planci]